MYRPPIVGPDDVRLNALSGIGGVRTDLEIVYNHATKRVEGLNALSGIGGVRTYPARR